MKENLQSVCVAECAVSDHFSHVLLSLALLCRRGSYVQRWVSLMRIVWPALPGIQMANALSLAAREASSTSVWVSFTEHTLLSVPTGSEHTYSAFTYHSLTSSRFPRFTLTAFASAAHSLLSEAFLILILIYWWHALWKHTGLSTNILNSNLYSGC